MKVRLVLGRDPEAGREHEELVRTVEMDAVPDAVHHIKVNGEVYYIKEVRWEVGLSPDKFYPTIVLENQW